MIWKYVVCGLLSWLAGASFSVSPSPENIRTKMGFFTQNMNEFVALLGAQGEERFTDAYVKAEAEQLAQQVDLLEQEFDCRGWALMHLEHVKRSLSRIAAESSPTTEAYAKLLSLERNFLQIDFKELVLETDKYVAALEQSKRLFLASFPNPAVQPFTTPQQIGYKDEQKPPMQPGILVSTISDYKPPQSSPVQQFDQPKKSSSSACACAGGTGIVLAGAWLSVLAACVSYYLIKTKLLLPLHTAWWQVRKQKAGIINKRSDFVRQN